jgi:hypothetical protein
MHPTYWFVTKLNWKGTTDNRHRPPTISRQESIYLPNGLKNDSDSLGESGGSAPQEDQDLELKKQELELCQTGPKYLLVRTVHHLISSLIMISDLPCLLYLSWSSMTSYYSRWISLVVIFTLL